MNGASKLTHLFCLRMYVSASCRKTSIAGSMLVSQSGEPWIHTLSAARPDAPAGVAATTDEATTNSHFLMWRFPFFFVSSTTYLEGQGSRSMLRCKARLV